MDKQMTRRDNVACLILIIGMWVGGFAAAKWHTKQTPVQTTVEQQAAQDEIMKLREFILFQQSRAQQEQEKAAFWFQSFHKLEECVKAAAKEQTPVMACYGDTTS